jgi:hypothetical protein
LNFQIPEVELIRYMMDNIPKFLPIHTLLATADARVLYLDPEGLLESLPYGFGVRVQKILDKPYSICEACYSDPANDNPDTLDHYDHFFDEPTDFDPRKYLEGAKTTG